MPSEHPIYRTTQDDKYNTSSPPERQNIGRHMSQDEIQTFKVYDPIVPQITNESSNFRSSLKKRQKSQGRTDFMRINDMPIVPKAVMIRKMINNRQNSHFEREEFNAIS